MTTWEPSPGGVHWHLRAPSPLLLLHFAKNNEAFKWPWQMVLQTCAFQCCHLFLSYDLPRGALAARYTVLDPQNGFPS